MLNSKEILIEIEDPGFQHGARDQAFWVGGDDGGGADQEAGEALKIGVWQVADGNGGREGGGEERRKVKA